VELALVIGLCALFCVLGFQLFGGSVRDSARALARCIESLSCEGGGSADRDGVSLDDRIAAAAAPAASAPPAAPAASSSDLPPAPATVPTHPYAIAGQHVIEWGTGVVKQAWDTVTSLYDVVTDLPGTWEGLKYTATNPKEAAQAVWKSMQDSFYENPSEFIGRATFEVATLGIGLAKIPATAAKAAKAAQAVRVATKVSKVAKHAKEANEAAGHVDTISVDESERDP